MAVETDGEVTQKDDDEQAAQVEQHEGEMPEGEQAGDSEQTEAPEADDELVITIGDESPASDEAEHAPAPAWVKELRKQDREKSRRIRELEEKLTAQTQPQAAEVPKPTLADCDYDEDAFAEKLTKWHEGQAAKKAEQAKAAEVAQKAQESWNAKLSSYKAAAATLKVSDFEDAEHNVREALDQAKQAILIQGAENPQQLVYALGKNPAELKKLASITDPIEYAFAVAKLETKMKVTPRKAAPAPERRVQGSAAASGITDSKLDKLEAEADRTNDRSKVIAYKRELKARQSEN